MKRLLLASAVCLAVASAGQADVVGQRWGGANTRCTHPGTLRIVQSRTGPRLVFDLSAIPKGATIHHASLHCFTQDDVQPTEPARVHATGKLEADGTPTPAGQPLALEAPWYRSFDATAAIERWVRDPRQNLGFTVAQFERLLAPRTYLEVLY